MATRKQILVNSLISFLKEELNGSDLGKEKRESLEVAIQCLETTFEVDDASSGENVDLLSLMTVKPIVSEEQIKEAENCKTKGNDFMRNAQYTEAIEEYTKAIDLNPNNAVYFCNRAAAYTRLKQDSNAITDCNEAIKLDPTYGKAYGRLGIAYSNLNQTELALMAYESALKYDPSNSMYEMNLNVAQQRIRQNQGSAATGPTTMPETFTEFMNSPTIINMASQILGDEHFHNMMSGLMQGLSAPNGEGVPAAVQSVFQGGQQFAERVASQDPEFYGRIARTLQNVRESGSNSNPPAPNDSTKEPSHEDQGSA